MQKGEILNDANKELANFWRVIRHHRDEMIDYLQYSIHSREIFDILKYTAPAGLTDIQRAARFYSLQCMCFGGKSTGQSHGVSKGRPPRLSKKLRERDRFTELAQLLNGLEGHFILSLNDRKEVRAIFANFHLKAVTTTYSAGRTAGSRGVARGELLITNFKLKGR